VGSSWHSASHDLRYVDYVVVVLAIAAVAYFFWRRRRPGTLSTHDDSSR
jgi:hypothetical protein